MNFTFSENYLPASNKESNFSPNAKILMARSEIAVFEMYEKACNLGAWSHISE